LLRAVTALDRVNAERDFLFPDADEKYVPEGLAYIQAATNHIRIDSNVCDGALKSDLHPAIEGDGLGGSDRARVADEVHRVAGKLPIRRLVKKRAIDQVVIIEEIVDEAEDLHIVGDLIGGVEIGHPIQRQLRVLVRIAREC
jgi:hypothetical protein